MHFATRRALLYTLPSLALLSPAGKSRSIAHAALPPKVSPFAIANDKDAPSDADVLDAIAAPQAPPPATGAAELLAATPVFAITNKKGQVYLTDKDAAGHRVGSFFLGPSDALATLRSIREFDPVASLSIVPLASIWEGVPKSAAEALIAAGEAPAPQAGTSDDLRLFSLRPMADELARARELKAEVRAGGVPLFFDVELQLEGPDGSAAQPFFFRAADLASAREQVFPGKTGRVDIRVVELATLVADAARGALPKDVAAAPMLIAASDASGVAQRTGLIGSGEDAGVAKVSDDSATFEERLIETCQQTPFAAGATKLKKSSFLGIF